ncbi:type III toxin-antitoxin system ToxN/AbiQ family toxin [Levilactobacillus mulengensis]|uniref:type III toxin-antitoxin system ToxN/AbiQ family toxin n=1 Tax=Levilactobacillus mulengensis TaxID=2486025 RepID=UPI000F77DE5E|nr:type III toxin-antitoxin system ToxN/AbiQ family toxin [Levilactobacillus mulengensis]
MILVYIEDRYITYLRQFDHRVLLNKSHRPYIGIILKAGKMNYFAPLVTAKPGKKINKRLAMNIWDNIEQDPLPLSYLSFNNMIPVIESVWRPVDMAELECEDVQKFKLLIKEISYIRPRESDVLKKAASVYNKQAVVGIPFFHQMCIDFKLLERKSLEFGMHRDI